MPILANVIQDAFSPLISVFEEIMVFIHGHVVGGSWGLAIVGLTVLIRAILVPLTYRQLKSMQEMQRLAPEINKLKEKYKEDKQRQQQEIMKFYQENKINPLASCLPLLMQLPVFVSLFYMLRTDLKKHICGPALTAHHIITSKAIEKATCTQVEPSLSRGQIPVHPGHHVEGDRSGAGRADRPLRRLAAGLYLHRDGDRRPEPAAADAAAAGRLRRDPLPVPGGAARVLDHHQPVDGRAAVLDPSPPTAAGTTDACGEREAEPVPASGDRRGRGRCRRQRSAARGGRCRRRGLGRSSTAATATQEEEAIGEAAMSARMRISTGS